MNPWLAVSVLPAVCSCCLALEELSVESYSFKDHLLAARVATDPFEDGGSGRIAFPYVYRSLNVKLHGPDRIHRLVLCLDRLDPQVNDPDAGVKTPRIYVSPDGVTYTAVQPGPISHQVSDEAGVRTDRISIELDTYGQYLRVYQPWDRQDYCFGLESLDRAIKLYGAKPLSIKEFRGDIFAAGEISVQFTCDYGAPAGMRLAVWLNGADEAILWSASVEGVAAGQSQRLRLPLPATVPGVRTLELRGYDAAGEVIARTRHLFRYGPGDLTLSPEAPQGWDTPAVCIGGREGVLWRAQAAAATLEFTIPASGYNALYATVAGTAAAFALAIDGQITPFRLPTWHPDDQFPRLAGEVFIHPGPLQAGSRLQIRAEKAGAALVCLRLAKLSDADLSLVNAPPDVIPAVILHDDGYSTFFSGSTSTPEDFQRIIREIGQSQAFGYDWCVGTTAVNYPSKVASSFGSQGNYWRDGDRKAGERVQKLLGEGHDPVKMVGDTCRQQHLRYSLTLRAAPGYNRSMSGMNSAFFNENPRFWLVDVTGRRLDKFSYAYPEVRAYLLAMIKEMAAYQPDAIVIEFLRHPPFFGYDPPLVETYRQRYGACSPENYLDARWLELQVGIMNDFVRQVRAAIDAASPRIQLEVSFDYALYRQHGLDIPGWLAQGWLDMISPGRYEIGPQKFFPLRVFAEMIKASPRPCKLFPRVEATILGRDPTPDEEKGLVKVERRNVSITMFKQIFCQFLHEGADGLRPFNSGGVGLANALADRRALRLFEHLEMPLLEVRAEVQYR